MTSMVISSSGKLSSQFSVELLSVPGSTSIAEFFPGKNFITITNCSVFQVHRLPDFSPCLLQIVMNEGVPLPSRQAGETCNVLASYPDLPTPAFVACSTNTAEGLVKLSHMQ